MLRPVRRAAVAAACIAGRRPYRDGTPNAREPRGVMGMEEWPMSRPTRPRIPWPVEKIDELSCLTDAGLLVRHQSPQL
jgi:hypothetical protein